jgi:hypothetical protein
VKPSKEGGMKYEYMFVQIGMSATIREQVRNRNYHDVVQENAQDG